MLPGGGSPTSSSSEAVPAIPSSTEPAAVTVATLAKSIVYEAEFAAEDMHTFEATLLDDSIQRTSVAALS